MRFLAIILAMCTAMAVQAEPLVVFAAASLKGPLDAVVAEWDGEVVVSYGSSAALARQIELGAPADVFISANSEWVDYLAVEHQLKNNAVIALFSNRLVVIAPAGGASLELIPEAISDRLDDGLLAIGFTNAVPAGIYGREALETLGLWASVRGHLAEVENVRAVLALVVRGDVPLGLVYASDAQAAIAAVTVVAGLPLESYPVIEYIGAVSARSSNPTAEDFLEHLGNDGLQTFLDAGFLPLPWHSQ